MKTFCFLCWINFNIYYIYKNLFALYSNVKQVNRYLAYRRSADSTQTLILDVAINNDAFKLLYVSFI